MNHTLADLLAAARAGRVVVETDGDSTAARNGRGHAAAVVAALAGHVGVAGVLMPFNHSDGQSEDHGYYLARRKDNQSVAYGNRGPADLFTPGYPTSFKQYGPNVPVDGGWMGPQVGYYPDSTIADGGDGITAAQTTIGLADASLWPTSGNGKIVSTGEVFSYTGKSGNTLTGVTRGRNIAAAIAAEGAVVLYGSNGPNVGALVHHDLVPVGAAMVVSVYAMSASASVISGATCRPALSTQSNREAQTAATTLVAGTTDANVTGNALGTVSRYDQVISGGDRGANSLLAGVSNVNWTGPWGPALYLYTGLAITDRDYGVIQAMGISQGGFRLNEKLSGLRRHHAATNTVEYDLGLTTRYGLYRQQRLGALGGNGRVALCRVNVWGHNEAGSTVHNGLVDHAVPWTVRGQTTLSGTLAAGATASLTLTDASVANMLSTAGGSILLRQGNNVERISYATRSGNTLSTLTRARFGTVDQNWTGTVEVYVGYPVCHPLGFASDLLFDYTLTRNCWLAAGGSASDFFYVWVRPLPPTDQIAALDLFSATTTNAEKEQRLRFYADEITSRLGGLDGFVVADLSRDVSGAEVLAHAFGQTSADTVHNSTDAYRIAWTRALGRAASVSNVRLAR